MASSRGPGLHLDVDQDQLRITFARSELRHDIGFPAASILTLGEDLLVEELEPGEIEAFLDVRVEELQEILQESVQELLEALVMSHCPSFH